MAGCAAVPSGVSEVPSHPASEPIRLTNGATSWPLLRNTGPAGLGVSKPAVTKHLKVLEGAGLVRRSVNGREHVLRIEPEALREVSDWLELHRALWERKFEVVEEFLAEDDDAKEAPK